MNQTEYDKCEAALRLFDSVRTAAMPWEEQEQRAGATGSGIAWELRSDIEGGVNEFLHYFASELSADDRARLDGLVVQFGTLPEEVFSASGRSAGVGLRHPSWEQIRAYCHQLLKDFAPLIRRASATLEVSAIWLDRL